MTLGSESGNRRLPDGRIALPEVTLVAASSLAIAASLRALRLSMEQLAFGAVKFFTDHPPQPDDPDNIERVAIPALSSRAAYSRFMLKALADHISTDFVLCVQWDGYVVNASGWHDDFLKVDYIGAPWPHFTDGHTVGNGGFSLRSRRLLRACLDSRIGGETAEDIVIGREARPLLEDAFDIVFADDALARCFSYERGPRSGNEFGFHGVFNMLDHMKGRDFRTLYRGLERPLLGRRETGDVARAALRRGDMRLFGLAARRWLAQRL